MPKKETPKKDYRWFYIMIIFCAAVFIAITLAITWSSIAHKQYLGSLTPEERAEINIKAEEAKLEKQKQQEENNKLVADLISTPIPLVFVIMIIFATWWVSRRPMW